MVEIKLPETFQSYKSDRPSKLKLPHGWQDVSLLEIRKLLPAWKERFLVEPIASSGWGFQRRFGSLKDTEPKKVDYSYPNRPLTDAELIDHFKGRPVKVGTYYRGALAFRGAFRDDMCRWFCLDVDAAEWVSIVSRTFLPVLDEYGIKYIYEYGGFDYERAHIWFMVDCDLELLQKFVAQLIIDSKLDKEMDLWRTERKKPPDIEFYPTQKPRNLIRTMAGPHMKAGTVYPVVYQNKFYEKTTDIMQCVIGAQVHTKFMIENKIRSMPKFTPGIIVKQETSLDPGVQSSHYKPKRKRFLYKPRNLDIPVIGLTKYGESLTGSCQSLHTLLERIRDEDWLNEPGAEIHRLGLYLSGLFKYSGIAQRAELKEELGEYGDHNDWSLEERDKFFEINRIRDEEGHQWRWLWKGNGERQFTPDCETWHSDFGLCTGCPYKDDPNFTNPKQLWYGDKAQETVISEIPIMAIEKIREQVFSETEREVIDALNKKKKVNLAVVPVTGSGKSTYSDELTARLVKVGYRVLHSTPSGQVAMEHRERQLYNGIDPLMLMSWKNTFKYLEKTLKCPFKKEITREVKVGVAASDIRRRYCSGCEYVEDCAFSTQYKALEEHTEDLNGGLCVIMQHAHFSIPQAMMRLKRLGFDVLIIDEEFVSAVKRYMKITSLERATINNLSPNYSWMLDIAHWLHGKEVSARFNVPANELVEVHEVFEEQNVQWRLPEIIAYIRNGGTYNKYIGILDVARMPVVPVRICLDATAYLPTIKAIFGTDNVKEIGRGILIDPIAQHPENEVIQIVDGTSSKKSREIIGKLNKQLDWWAMKLRTDWSWMQKSLVTVFKDEIVWVQDYFKTRHPDIAEKVLVASMAVGTNEWSDVDGQLLLAAIYFNTKDIKIQTWEHKFILDRQLEDGRQRPNLFPVYSMPGDGITSFKMPVRIIKRHVREDGVVVGQKVQLDSYQYSLPIWESNQISPMMAEFKTLQAIRARLLTGKKVKIVIWNNRRMYGFCCTDHWTESETISQLSKWEEENGIVVP